MTALNVALAGSVTLSQGFARAEPLSPPDTSSLRELVTRLVEHGTGTQAAHETAVETSIFARMWAAAAARGRDTEWHQLLDKALEALEARQEGAMPADLTFVASTMDRPRVEVLTAVRLLGAIGEDGLAPVGDVRALLADFLEHRDPAVRIAAVEAFWQIADKASAPKLKSALDRETHPEVRDNLMHVLYLFE
jgi:hypothetical protein